MFRKIKFSTPVVYSSAILSYTWIRDKEKELHSKEFTYKELEKHNNKETGIWTSYKNNIYDITKFIDIHPGGSDKIMLAAGTSVDQYWVQYKQHLKPEVIDKILKPMKIGTIKDYDKNKHDTINDDTINADKYINEPIRSTNLDFHSFKPCNAEVNPKILISNYITPNNQWYIRNHSNVPNIDINNYKLNIDITKNYNDNIFTNLLFTNNYNYNLNLNKIKLMNSHSVITTLQCGGNRRKELNNHSKTLGTSWGIGAISTAKFTGVLLKDLLPKNINKNIKFVNIKGYDDVEVSIPIEKVMNPYGDVILAYEMNDELLPKDHGYPLRLIVPGYVGIRNIKWIKSIKLSDKCVDNQWQTQLSYKALPNFIKNMEDIKLNNINLESYYPINSQPVTSAICDIDYDEEYIIVKGYAYSGDGKNILHVDVSIDGGETWKLAELKDGSEQEYNRAWSWTLWEIKIPYNNKNSSYNYYFSDLVPLFKNSIKIMCKATDSGYNIQPKTIEDIWNIRGLNNNSIHSVDYNI